MGFGHDEGVVIGKVEDVLPATRENAPDVMIVLDSSNEKYPNRVACEFPPKMADKLNGLAPGDYVKVVGAIRSKPWNERWFTNFVAYSVMKLDIGMPAAAPPPRTGSGRPQHRDVGADDDIPF